ncbi:MAG: helix-turn-helix domain-containing protein [Microthrixaceae bacterium]
MQATIECLVDYGYAGTTTRLVADRAGVSRGAQTHHYPTKRDLVVAAIDQLFAEQARAFAQVFEQVPQADRTYGRAIDRAVGDRQRAGLRRDARGDRRGSHR